jgi:hypothetical protein
MKDRTMALLALLLAERPIQTLLSELDDFPWDSPVELAVLNSQHLVDLLHRFLAGDLSAEDVESWANAVEGRDDIGYEAAFEAELKECIFQLANPDLGYPLTPELVRGWIGRFKCNS